MFWGSNHPSSRGERKIHPHHPSPLNRRLYMYYVLFPTARTLQYTSSSCVDVRLYRASRWSRIELGFWRDFNNLNFLLEKSKKINKNNNLNYNMVNILYKCINIRLGYKSSSVNWRRFGLEISFVYWKHNLLYENVQNHCDKSLI